MCEKLIFALCHTFTPAKRDWVVFFIHSLIQKFFCLNINLNKFKKIVQSINKFYFQHRKNRISKDTVCSFDDVINYKIRL